MLLLSAKPVVEKLNHEVFLRVKEVTKKLGRAPKLSVILVGNDPASQIYTSKKGEAAVKLGMLHESHHLPASVTPQEVKKLVDRLNEDPTVDGILIQRPLPKSFIEEEVVYWVDPSKDVDAFHPENAGRLVLGLPCFRPCTPHGVMEILDHYGLSVSGKTACVIGRSSIVGKPLGSLLLQRDATVFQCHSKSPDLKKIAASCDFLFVAVGRMGLVGQDYIKKGAVVVDVGIHRNAQGKVVGDVLFDEVKDIAQAITPVPGGVGPMTIAVLMQNTVWSAEKRAVKSMK
ncbi:MAG: bifunctional 5,10-methylenetetrahydrofolate dehydrogenase/5,10-methenyltetrahydrofolate cyclohydrolase [Bdellovibrionales bacterium]|nr:bifunctional 5,10-methylenetetrahydrofolate dehydrogenase/5,10-methenyltetrahydrofolate cyclohydrolase [Bdellovibrionales bacterium]